MTGAGQVRVTLLTRGEEIVSLSAQAERPLGVLRLLQGRPLAEGLRWLTLMFPLCGMAHGLAALTAVEAALACPVDPAHGQARRLLLAADVAAAHQWRCALDWPALAGREPDVAALAAARRRTEAVALALYPAGDALQPGGGRLQPDAGRLAALAEAAEAEDPRQRLAALQSALGAAMRGTDAALLPAIQQRLHAMADAVIAQRAALHALLSSPPATADPRVSNPAGLVHGSAEVETARGPLGYHVSLADGLWRECQIEAPIDRLFAAEGEAGAWLQRLRRAADPVAATRWMIAALDPCAGVQIEHRHV